jgi:thioesterase domain-containing protein/acyl carrier protein
MPLRNYTEIEIEQLLKDCIVQKLLIQESKMTLENDALLIEEGIIDSLGILTLTSLIEKQFDIHIAPEEIVLKNFKDINSIRSLVLNKVEASTQKNIIQEDKEKNLLSLIPIKPKGNKRPFFYVHGFMGYGSDPILSNYMHPDRPFYGLQAVGLHGEQEPYTCMEDLVDHYIQEIQTVLSEGPYLLGGRCIGGNIAFAMAQELRKRDQQVLLLTMSDSPNPFEEAQRIEWLNYWQSSGAQSWQVKLANDGLSSSQVEKILSVMAANSQIIANYKPQLYSGRVIYFSAEENCEPSFDPMQPNGWNSWVANGIEVVKVPGKHGIYHAEPHVRVLAEKLNSCLEQAE